MIWIDYAILGLIGISSVVGFVRGFVREAFSLLSWALAVWVGLGFSRDLSVYLDTAMTDTPSLRIATAFVILFLVTLVISSMATYLIRQLVEKSGLSATDRLAGLMFGISRGILITSIIILLAGLTPLPEDTWWKESMLIAFFQSLALWLRDHLSADMAAYVSFPG